MILTIDIGNTSAKLALYTAEAAAHPATAQALHFERLNTQWQDTLEHLVQTYGKPTQALISNVAGPQPELKNALQAQGIPTSWLQWDTPQAEQFLRNIPQGLGADRLAADIGARVMAPAKDLLVVDAGTCLTFDVIAADGAYIGGSISPGIGLRLKAMHDHTAALPLLQPEGPAPVVGTDLDTAMRGGCLNGLRWEIEGYVRHLIAAGHANLHVFYTGGNDLMLAPDVDRYVHHDAHLIFRGLLALYTTA